MPMWFVCGLLDIHHGPEGLGNHPCHLQLLSAVLEYRVALASPGEPGGLLAGISLSLPDSIRSAASTAIDPPSDSELVEQHR